MSSFSANTAEMRGRAQAVQGTIERLRAEVNTMQAGLRDLESSWHGAAASNFQAVVADWRATQMKVEESLTAINTALSHASQQYDDAEAANARMFTY
ncbi:MAG: WXG100 family type VII secretion target [Arthrobacter sp.]|uniref:WXG100 family type VII secretion target n=1 Tax=unclassified Arthrobacter TaxID=235627 RepID=UPI00264FC112|nr:WXG100 family type VII secretion target [Micrococcaceae bacterium]MDN5812787.1 WXG100 family type VII secretion target [Micrococcaceae bacterium]MDN5823724.1 WXG100 family type VII secretion target [Micrococcaceae bacterium]MDN5879662.1 WXG100 family type VII secretion target [Micrococcaceae bacterium]MDN5887541.1 WXG100 family type VII secretion target [Micrococcaceae bacterium]